MRLRWFRRECCRGCIDWVLCRLSCQRVYRKHHLNQWQRRLRWGRIWEGRRGEGRKGGSIQSAFELIPRPVLRPQVADQIALSISSYRLPLLPVATSRFHQSLATHWTALISLSCPAKVWTAFPERISQTLAIASQAPETKRFGFGPSERLEGEEEGGGKVSSWNRGMWLLLNPTLSKQKKTFPKSVDDPTFM